MKISTVSKYITFIFFLLFNLELEAQEATSDTIKVKAGKLSELLGSKKDVLKSLTLKGEINGTDITTIRSMAKLSILNLTDVKIVKGGTFISSIYNENIEYDNNEVPEEMFYGKDNLSIVILPENTVAIGVKAFSDCTKLTSIIIPDGTRTIGTNAFISCTGLSSVTIPGTMTMIDYAAFQECTSLSKIYCKGVLPPKITPYTFFGVNKNNCKVHIPKGALAAYQGATGWSEFKNMIEE
jgi:hypothetical protein